MTWTMFVGCCLVSFGPPLALFLFFISKNAPLVVLMIGSSFFWLLSILLSSVVWYVFFPLRTYYFCIIPITVALQETMRWLFFKVYMKAKTGLEKGFVGNSSSSISLDYFSASLSVGLGFGFTQAVIMYGSMLVEAIGPGSLFTPACPDVNLFLLSAVLALAFIGMHVFLTIISFDTFKAYTGWQPFWGKTAIIVLGHLTVSLLTLLNQEGGNCIASVVLVYVVVAMIGTVAVRICVSSPDMLKK